MSKNKLYTCGYFRKRLVERGFDVVKLNIPYEQDDVRKWTVVVNKQKETYKMNILITCFKNNNEFSFKFQGQRKKEFLLETLTMNMIIAILLKAYEHDEEDLSLSVNQQSILGDSNESN